LVKPKPLSLLEINRPKVINGLFLELHVKKFVNGGGSIIKLAVGAKHTTFTDYIVYSTYDQGSRKMGGKEGFFDYLEGLLFVLSPFIYFTVAESIVLLYLGYGMKRSRMRRFSQQVTEDLMQIRRSLRYNPLARHIVPVANACWQGGINYSYFFALGPTFKRHLSNDEIINEIRDFVRIDDFYSKLVERNSYIRNNQVINDFELAELNRQCLELAEDALTKVNWSKYR
jgi:hypothetical protein